MRSVVKGLAKRGAASVDRVRSTEGVTVLIYHRVGARTPVSVDLPTGLFTDQMAYLADCCDVLTLDEAAAVLSGQLERPSSARQQVVVTFDDGTADFVDDALPVLADHGIPAVMYLATDFVENQRAFPDDGVPMTWGAARDAQSTGLITFGSHTDTHAMLDRLTPEAAAAELDRSVDLIGSHLGVEVSHFAYPRAVPAPALVEAEVRRRFTTASLARTRPNPIGATDLHRLWRSPVQVADGMRWFEAKVHGGMGLEDDLRVLVNRWRYRS